MPIIVRNYDKPLVFSLGFNREEVNEFLDTVARDYEDLSAAIMKKINILKI